MNNELLIIDKSGKAFRCVDYCMPKRGEKFLERAASPEIGTAGDNWALGNRHTLEEVPSPYILREGVDELVAAAQAVDGEAAPTIDKAEMICVYRGYFEKLAAALEPFQSPPEVQERFYEEAGWIRDRENPDAEPEIFVGESTSRKTLIALLNELNNQLETEK